MSADSKIPKFTKTIIQEGSGWEHPRKNWEVRVNIKAKVLDNIFDSNEGEGEPRSYVLGSGALPSDLDEAIKKMKKGEKASIEVKEAYGEAGLPDKVMINVRNRCTLQSLHVVFF